MSTTLVNELMMAADAWAQLANVTPHGMFPEQARQIYVERMARSERLRERAEWTREIERQSKEPDVRDTIRRWVVALTGPIPAAETAPTRLRRTVAAAGMRRWRTTACIAVIGRRAAVRDRPDREDAMSRCAATSS